MSDLNPLASTASLLTANTTSSSFNPSKADATKRPKSQKDYAAALSTLQSRFGLPQASPITAPLLPPSKKPPTLKSLSAPPQPLGTTPSSYTTATLPPAGQGGAGWAKKGHSSLLSLFRAHSRKPSSPHSSSALPEMEEPGAEGDGEMGCSDRRDVAMSNAPLVGVHRTNM
ncbi:hypothetical protein F5148DRAFT_1290948 [Russula earlei]|uniref:Uncharacterized protein n=1 Tax=Russula earlei TaxID=71964 RepID=A0ACC0TWE9_9AGAM|nr:hypothetical protein F5148DRAFT_1290948 [Russula earlei]